MRYLAFAAVLALATPAAAQSVDRWSGHIAEASARFGVPDTWIRRVMQAESGGRTALNGRPITSRAGAMGLMQLMPGTWREMQLAHGLGADPHDPRDNIIAGTAYLRAMYDRFGYPGLFAAYNAGPARYARHLSSGRRLPAETVAYVAKVAGESRHDAPRAPATPLDMRTSAGVFVAMSGRPVPGASEPLPPAPSPLFVRLTTAAAAPQ